MGKRPAKSSLMLAGARESKKQEWPGPPGGPKQKGAQQAEAWELLTRGLTGSWKGRLRLLQHSDRISFSHFCRNHKWQAAHCFAHLNEN